MSGTSGETLAQRLGGTLTRWRVMAIVVGALLAVMTVIGLPYKYAFGGDAAWYSIGWQVHGILYMLYLLATLELALKAKWSPLRAVVIALAGTIPFLSFYFERKITAETAALPV